MPVHRRMGNKAVSAHTGEEQTAAHNIYSFTTVVSRGREGASHKSVHARKFC